MRFLLLGCLAALAVMVAHPATAPPHHTPLDSIAQHNMDIAPAPLLLNEQAPMAFEIGSSQSCALAALDVGEVASLPRGITDPSVAVGLDANRSLKTLLATRLMRYHYFLAQHGDSRATFEDLSSSGARI